MGGGIGERIGQDNPRCFLVYGLLILFVSFVLKKMQVMKSKGMYYILEIWGGL